ncbi:MAG: amino acid adenylation domain-containing protein, partial [Bacteroidota bacterium]
DHSLLMIVHHIANDGWSSGIMINELVTFYQAFKAGVNPGLPPLPIQYADFAIWQRRHLDGEVLQEKLAWWENQLQGLEPLDLPTDFLRPAVQRTQGERVTFSLDRSLSASIQQLAKAQGATLFMTLLSAFKVLLYRYTGQTDVCVGTPIANRGQQEVEPLIGFFLNNLALRTELGATSSFEDVLQRVKGTTLDAYARQEVPFERVVDRVDPDRDMSRSPIFQTVFVLNNTPPAKAIELSEVSMAPGGTAPINATVDIHVMVLHAGEDIDIGLTYNSDLFKAESMQRLCDHFVNILEQIAEQPNLAIHELSLLSEQEKQQILQASQGPRKAIPASLSILDLWNEQVHTAANRNALIFQDQAMSYQELDSRAERLAQHLAEQGLQKGDLLALCMHRSPDLIIALLATFQLGAAFVSIDPELPEERIRYLLSDSQAKMVLGTPAAADKVRAISDLQVLRSTSLATKEVALPKITLQQNDLAYIIYTSGSTGLPKGVLIEHGGLLNILLNQKEPMGLEPGKKVLQFASISFDAAVYEIWVALINGCTLLIPDKDTVLSADEMGDLLVETDFATLPTSYQHFVAPHLKHLEVLVSVGEAMDVQLAQELKTHGVKVYNGYGPTENTIASSLSLDPVFAENAKASIGRPFSNVDMYLLDQHQQLLPQGLVGEIYLGGAQLARAYLNRPDLTEQAFIQHPEFGRLYRTGDLARRLSDYSLEFVGRRDQQVKLRGYRIELGEIEKLVEQLEDIDRCVVIVHEGENGSKTLVAYIASSSSVDMEQLTAFLKTQLPEYMLPATWIAVEQMPLLANGKIDKKSLPAPTSSTQLGRQFVAPRDEVEEQLVEICKEVLEVEEVGVHDDFFDLGGHSLLAVRFVVQVQKRFDMEWISLTDFFNYPNVAELGAFITNAPDTTSRIIRLNQIEEGRANIFFLPPILGLPIVYKGLAFALQSEYNAYGLQYMGIGSGEEFVDSIDELSLILTDEILRQQPEACIRLAAYSFGGIVAFEVAKQLEAYGLEVVLVILDRNPNLVAKGIAEDQEFDKEGLANEEEANLLNTHVMPAYRDRILNHIIHNQKLDLNHQTTGEINGPIIALEAKEGRDKSIMEDWASFTKGPFIHLQIPGEHSDIFRKEYLPELSAALKDGLSRS